VLPPGTDALVHLDAWNVPTLFSWLKNAGDVPNDDMLRTFNMGIGLILVVAASDADAVIAALRGSGEPEPRVIGEIEKAGNGTEPRVRYAGHGV
jgi:phosphoribosylformylglycinamidine cyclo-ligase